MISAVLSVSYPGPSSSCLFPLQFSVSVNPEYLLQLTGSVQRHLWQCLCPFFYSTKTPNTTSISSHYLSPLLSTHNNTMCASQLTSGQHVRGNPISLIPALFRWHTANEHRNLPSIIKPDHCLSRKFPSDPEREFFSDAMAPNPMEETLVTFHLNALLPGPAQQSLGHVTSQPSTQSYEAHTGIPVLPDSWMLSWKKSWFPGESRCPSGQETVLSYRPRQTGLMIPCSQWLKYVSQIYWGSLQQLLSAFGLCLILDRPCEIQTGWLFPDLW